MPRGQPFPSRQKRRAAQQVLARKVAFRGWKTTDEEEIERRRLRASIEPLQLERLEPQQPFYGTYRVRSSDGGRPYTVEIRSLEDLSNSCECPDYRVNGLGTCKHIEGVLASLRKGRSRLFSKAEREGSPRVEVYLSPGSNRQVRVAWPQQASTRAKKLLSPYFSSEGVLLADPTSGVPALKRVLSDASDRLRAEIRIAREVDYWVSELRRRSQRLESRAAFLEDVKAGKRSLNCLRHTLYPYQEEGMLHLAFEERALLADDMGLGKTIQAIAACELLRQIRRIERVLVVCPVSLKAEWEEQIAKFSGLPTLTVLGPRALRLKLYRQQSFFYVTNYEQIRSDGDDIVRMLAPDVVILDEAQRIKNWQTQTAKAVKRLSSPFAFVLTGTPLENRIDEIYSIMEFLDPQLLGPLFRFNRDFYDLDEQGRPQGYRNLDELHRRIRRLMLRRRKDEVEDQLPGRTVNNYFVTMEAEQELRYDEFNTRVARLLGLAKRRPLTKEEGEKLQKWLACMRMICDSPFILDQECRICPKLGELESLLDEVLQANGSKVLIFSEWERMLQLVRQLADEMGLGYAWHTGSVPQKKRREEINRFKQDPACQLFLSTDSGSTGLNLQVANTVVNLDLPWNPAKLEQRIARAWRKHQSQPVTVVNLVCEKSIEHRMLGLLSQKQELADGVLDGRGDLKSIKLPSGRAAFIERLEALMGVQLPETVAATTGKRTQTPSQPEADPYEVFGNQLVARLADRLLLLESRQNGTGQATLLGVVEGSTEQIVPLAQRLLRESFESAGRSANGSPKLELMDRETFETIQRLVDSGLLEVKKGSGREIFRSSALSKVDTQAAERRCKEAQAILAKADRQMRMAALLSESGFAIEAAPPLGKCIELSLGALAHLHEEQISAEEGVPLNLIQSRWVAQGIIPDDTLAVVARVREHAEEKGELDESGVPELVQLVKRIFDQVQVNINKSALS